MPELTIDFGHNWNSNLCCQYLTTIRVRNDYKYEVGKTYELTYKKEKQLGPGIIHYIAHFTMAQFTPVMAMINMGYPLDESKKILLTMYKNKNFNWDTQQFSLILIQQTAKKHYHEPEGGHYEEVGE